MSEEPAAAATPAPAAPAATPAAAPSSPTPSASPAPASAPKTAADALKGAAARLAAPASPAGKPGDQPGTETVVTPPAGAKPATPEGQPATPPPGEGNIAQLRTAYEGAKKQIERLAWAGEITAEEGRAAISLLQDLRKDPVAFYRQLNQDLIGHPEYSKALQPAAPPQEDPEPQADLVTKGPNGEVIKVFSDAQLRKREEWKQKQFERMLDERLNPLNEFHRTAQQERHVLEVRQRAASTTQSVMTEMRKLPHFGGEANEAKIAEKLQSIPPQTRKQLGAIASLQMAYNLHLRDNVFPTLSQTAEQRVREDMARKANAGAGSVIPGGGTPPVATTRPKNERELAAHMKKLAGALTQ